MPTNPNTMTLKESFDREYQISLFKRPVYKAFADESIHAMLDKGNTVNKSYSSDFDVNDMGGDGSYEQQSVLDTNEKLEINYEKEVSFYVKKLDELQAHLPVRTEYAQKAMNRLFLQIDGDFMAVASAGAANYVDDGDLGGTAGNPLVVTSTNVSAAFAANLTKLQLANVIFDAQSRYTGEVKLGKVSDMPVAAISPLTYNAVIQFLGGKETPLGDKVSTSGHAGYFQGFNIFVSNALYFTAQLNIATNPTDGDTVTINGVAFRFKSTLAANGDVKIGDTAADTVDNLVAAINAPSTGGTTFDAFEATDTTTFQGKTRKKTSLLKNISATDGTTYLTIAAKGWGIVNLAETLTAAADGFSKITSHNLFGVSKSVRIAIQVTPNMEMYDSKVYDSTTSSVKGRVGKDIVVWTVYGIKVFKDNSYQLVDNRFDVSATATMPLQYAY